jgi:hypothetical protein
VAFCQAGDRLFDVLDSRADVVEHPEGDPQVQEMFLAPRSGKLVDHLLVASPAARVSELGQALGIAFAIHDRAYHGHARPPGDVRDSAVHAHVHLVHFLLHAAYPVGAILHEHELHPGECPESDDILGRAEGTLDQAVGMQLLKPLAVGHVRLAARQARHAPRVGERHCKPPVRQHLVEGYPVDAGALHGHAVDAILGKPVGELDKRWRVGAEGADFRRGGGHGTADEVLRGSQVDAGGVGADHCERLGLLARSR